MTATPLDERLAAAFERAPDLVDRLRERVADDDGAEAIVTKARALIARMSEDERVAILDAHPRIGADPRTLSAPSRREQGLATDTDVARDLARLNDEYERRFGFRFVVFVNGRSRREIVPVLGERLARRRDEELARGIDELLAIAADRLRRTWC